MGIYHGWTESEENRIWRNQKRQLAEFEFWYGKDFEATATEVHNLIEAAEAGDKWIAEKTAEHADWLGVQATRESDRPQ